MHRTKNDGFPTPYALAVYRTVLGMMLLALLWKCSGFLIIAQIYKTIELNDPFFPSWLRSSITFIAAYLIVIITAGLGLFSRSRRTLLTLGITNTLVMGVLCIHQGSYNDVTFFTAFWTSLWCLWFLHRSGYDSTETLLRKGACLANIILAMFLFGGAVGKWTAEYWSGSVLYEIYFHDRDYWVFNILRNIFDNQQLPIVAKWYSRFVIVVETVVAIALWGLPRHYGGAIAMLVFVSLAVLSNWLLFSVVLSAIGLATVGPYLYKYERRIESARIRRASECKVIAPWASQVP